MKYILTLIAIFVVVVTMSATTKQPREAYIIEIYTAADIYYVNIDKLRITSETDMDKRYTDFREMMLEVARLTANDTNQAWEDCSKSK